MPSYSLAGSIVESLKEHEMSSSLIATLLSRDRHKALHRDESDYWDYKREIDIDSPSGVTRIAKDVLAFHNTKGGVLIIGIDDDYRVVGIPKSQVTDTYVIKNKLRKYTGPDIDIFQDTIDVQHNRVIWLLFIPRRTSIPVAVQSNGPQDKTGRFEIRVDDYYIRIGDQTILCKERSHQERLWIGSSLDHIHPYLYDVDEPYFRLLAPNCDRFFGRKEILTKVGHALKKARQPVIALDGIGGVGKTEVALALTQHLYDAREHAFIVSISAKNRVWSDGGIQSVRAGFSGLRELLLEIAKVLHLSIPADLDDLKDQVIKNMASFNGLLLLDNLEDIHDESLLYFLTYEVPEPVKVLITSRVDKGIGALTISIPQMNDFEARELLCHELERGGYTGFYDSGEEESICELLRITGCVPLAIKWAAATTNNSSLGAAVTRLQKMSASKKEFLNFCFATMFDTISNTLARDVALIAPRLGEHWNVVTCSMILDKPETEVEAAVAELKSRGILLDSSQSHPGALYMLPLTADYLRAKYKENRYFQEKVEERITDLFASSDNGDNLLKFGNHEERVDKLYDRADQLRSKGSYENAAQMIKLALKESSAAKETLEFMNGRIQYESGEVEEGLRLMGLAAAKTEGDQNYAEDHLYFARALNADGSVSDSKKIPDLLRSAISSVKSNSKDDIKLLFHHGNDSDIFNVLRKLRNPETIYWITASLEKKLDDRQFIYLWGRDLSDALTKAATYEGISDKEKRRYKKIVQLIEKQYRRAKE